MKMFALCSMQSVHFFAHKSLSVRQPIMDTATSGCGIVHYEG